MNPEQIQEALEKVTNANVLVNIVSRRVRQLSTPGAKGNRPLLTDTATMSHSEIALAELLSDKMDWEFADEDNPIRGEFKGK